MKKYLSSIMNQLRVAVFVCLFVLTGCFLLNQITVLAETSIPSDAYIYNGHAYYVFNVLSSSLKGSSAYTAAEAYCESLGGHLATITSAEENAFVYQAMVSQGYKSAYFGLSDEDYDKTWVWVTGETSSYTNWATGEPSYDYNPREAYALFYYKYTTGKWNDGDFGNSTQNAGKAFICEWETVSSVGKITSLTNTSSGIKIQWSAVTGVTGYNIYRKTASGSYVQVVTIYNAGVTSFTDTVVKNANGTIYTYKVVPFSASSEGTGEGKTTVRLTGTKLSSVKNSSAKKATVKP